ncbi:MAG: TfoX/Sxy family protein, partial [Verrucomicrobiales bacterium]
MLRLGEDGAAAARREPHVRPMDFTGKPIKSMAFVEPEGLEREEDRVGGVGKALDFVRALPKK